jgi:hypothetical protein
LLMWLMVSIILINMTGSRIHITFSVKPKTYSLYSLGIYLINFLTIFTFIYEIKVQNVSHV